MSARLDELDLALLAGLREISSRRAARRATMTVLDGGGGAMARWVRRGGKVLDWWHLLEPGRTVAACGEQLGEDQPHLDEVTDESIIGNRCPACQGSALGGEAR